MKQVWPEYFVADGRERLVASEEYQRQRAEIIAEIHAACREALRGAGFFHGLLIQARMERELRRRIRNLAPRDALYLKAPR